jgi:hypothetical protein
MECIKIKFSYKDTLLHTVNRSKDDLLNTLEANVHPHVIKMRYDSRTRIWNCAINVVDNTIENKFIKSIARFLDRDLQAFDIKIVGRNLIWR